jgi:holo-[acyl-carrier protein] synthase
VIHGIGVDMVRVARVEAALERFGERFALRVLAPEEVEDFRRSRRPASFLAKRFAAKEAAVKALGTGFRQGLAPRHIAVTHNHMGRPGLAYYGPALDLARRRGIVDSQVSLSDEHEYALAFVTLSG